MPIAARRPQAGSRRFLAPALKVAGIGGLDPCGATRRHPHHQAMKHQSAACLEAARVQGPFRQYGPARRFTSSGLSQRTRSQGHRSTIGRKVSTGKASTVQKFGRTRQDF